MRKKQIGILALQGGVIEHVDMLASVGIFPVLVRKPEQLCSLSGIILPGGESTAIGKLLHKNKLFEPLKMAIENGLPAWGTCAGAILLGKGGSEYCLGLGNYEVDRNAYGSQLDSFETTGTIKGIADDFPLVFIRAPKFCHIGNECEILAKIGGEPIFLQSGNIWATAFHPELSGDNRVHAAFVKHCLPLK